MIKQKTPSQPITVTTEAQRELLLIDPPLAALAKAAGVSRMTASRWKRGEDRPDFMKRADIESAYGVPAYLWAFGPARSEAHRLAYHGMSSEHTNPTRYATLLDTPAGFYPLAAIVTRRAELGCPEPSPLATAQQPVAPAPPAKPPRASTGRPTHAWVRKCMAAEVARKGYEQALADWQKRSGGYVDEFIEPEDACASATGD